MTPRFLLTAPTLLTLVLCLFLPSPVQDAAQSDESRRELKIKTFDGAPVVVREVRNLQKDEDWLRDLEIEIKNVSDRPVYSVNMLVLFPDIPAPLPVTRADGITPARSASGFPLTFGSPRLGDIKELAAPEDESLQPGETYVFKVPDSRVQGLKSMERRMGLTRVNTGRIEIEITVISFGDGTGLVGRRKRDYRNKGGGGIIPLEEPIFRKARWNKSAPTRARPQTGCGQCSPYIIKRANPENSPFCIPRNYPADPVCYRAYAQTRVGEPCTQIIAVAFDCYGTRCSNDDYDLDASETCPGGESCGGVYMPGAASAAGEEGIPAPSLPEGGGEGCGCDSIQRMDCQQGGGEWLEYSCACVSPVLIDLDGDGFDLTDGAGGVAFDFTGDGTPELMSWTAAGSDDSWLFLDRNGNGMVDNGQELFGTSTPQPAPSAGEERNGFAALAVYDRLGNGGNADGVIDARDAIYKLLWLWRDMNHNGVSEAGELHGLASVGVSRIHLDYKESKRTDEHGNRFRFRAKVDDARGMKVSRWAWDIFPVKPQPQ